MLSAFDRNDRPASIGIPVHHRRNPLLGRPVDLVRPKAVINPFLLASINQSREVICAS
jgi:hypothetical protein